MLNIFKKMLPDNVVIQNIQEYSNKYKINLRQNTEIASCELQKTCAPKGEDTVCKTAIKCAMSSIYINKGDLSEAAAWLHDQRWGYLES